MEDESIDNKVSEAIIEITKHLPINDNRRYVVYWLETVGILWPYVKDTNILAQYIRNNGINIYYNSQK